jgi:hypothetical protein
MTMRAIAFAAAACVLTISALPQATADRWLARGCCRRPIARRAHMFGMKKSKAAKAAIDALQKVSPGEAKH